MARKNGSSSSNSQPPHRFLDIRLNERQKDDLRGYDLEEEFPRDMVDDLVRQGYKYSLSYDPKNDTYIASLTDRLPGSAFQSTTLTGRGSTAANAHAALLYRHFVVANEEWGNFPQSQDVPSPDFD